ncbi:hypothetical protein EIK77_000849 [Talaromyces pinophilus]|nr:hypothetical protein EIK77_006436 [Talaromyces pinophilus]KAI7975489.1 hypothetical protein EIK77_000861 [Talaromyces pinophilus]KAI7976011.1 hypothetical protein EIK77_000924 [Talaromyces pinophilus]KAI7978471.1 hypothetical protein EIK77_000849 [Talaromyces pinophilus]
MQSAVNEAWSKLNKLATDLNILGVLDGNQRKLAENARNAFITVPTERRGRIYKLFLHEVLRASSAGAVLVCAIGLGKNRIADDLSPDDCTSLLPLIKESDALNHSTVTSLAIGGRNVTEVPASSSTTLNEFWENASLEGISRVFKQRLCDEIRRVNVQGELKAAVTTAFPTWAGPIDCLISLEVSKSSVDWLALALFGVQVKLIDGIQHFITKSGFSLVVPHTEATMKGAPDEAIDDVFGLEILTAIAENPIRKRELEMGMLVTECVSMILVENGAIINLALNLHRGAKIQEKLYT